MLFSLHVALLTGALNKAAGLNWTYVFLSGLFPGKSS